MILKITEQQFKRLLNNVLREQEEQENIFVPHNLEGREQQKIDRIKRLLRKKAIDGDLDLRNIPITNLGNVEVVNGYLDLYENKTLKTLGNLKRVNKYVFLGKTNIEDIGNLEYVGDWLDLYNNKTLKSLGNLKRVEGGLGLGNTNIEDFGNLQYIGGNLYLYGSKLAKKYSNYRIRKIINIKGVIKRI